MANVHQLNCGVLYMSFSPLPQHLLSLCSQFPLKLNLFCDLHKIDKIDENTVFIDLKRNLKVCGRNASLRSHFNVTYRRRLLNRFLQLENGYIVPQNIVVVFFMVFQSFDTHDYSTFVLIRRAQAHLQFRRVSISYTMSGRHYNVLTDDATTAEVVSRFRLKRYLIRTFFDCSFYAITVRPGVRYVDT
uniref:Uncharacterized protein n=1 Tax=Glossina palpalis gambiensis TaxID=67801 RepID=A0A1B0B289_9MUSC